ncbi:MAG: hypothetical protein AAF655_18380 [Bacteroidota bacterium]
MENRIFSSLALCCLFLFISFSSYSQNLTLTNAELLGFQSMHTGELTYKNYNDGNLITLPFVGVTYQKKGKLVIEHAIYEGGRVINQKYGYETKNGQLVGGGGTWQVLDKQSGPDGKLTKLVVSRRGKDGNERKKCTFRTTMDISAVSFTIIKEVKFDDEEEYFMRNKYTMNKYPPSGN